MPLEVIPVKIEAAVKKGDDLVEIMFASNPNLALQDGDILVFTQKIISKQEGQVFDLVKIMPTALATGIASEYGKDPRIVQLILDQSKRLVRMRNGIIISETVHGFVCANAGVDESNVEEGYATLLPPDADASAENLRKKLSQKTGKDVAVVISDTFGRPFREGQTNVAIGVSGINPMLDYAGTRDAFGKILRVTLIGIADELCSASELVMGKSLSTPVSIIRNYHFDKSKSAIKAVLRKRSADLFR